MGYEDTHTAENNFFIFFNIILDQAGVNVSVKNKIYTHIVFLNYFVNGNGKSVYLFNTSYMEI